MSAHISRSFGCFSAFSLCLAFALSAQNQNSTNPPETVCVKVSVTDPLNRIVTGLKPEHFRIYEDNTEQTIASFSQTPVPTSIGIIWDVNPSRNGGANFEIAKITISRLLRSRNPEDECFLINFSESAPIQPITHKMLPTDVQIDKSKKRIALFDAVYMGLDVIHQSKHDRRALIVISDGVETYGRHKASEIREYAMESDIQIYSIMKYDETKREPFGNTIQNIASTTGGRVYFHNYLNDLDHYIDLIHAQLRSQYLLCYTPTNNRHDGTLRKIKIKLDPPPKLPKLIIQARKERYALKN